MALVETLVRLERTRAIAQRGADDDFRAVSVPPLTPSRRRRLPVVPRYGCDRRKETAARSRRPQREAECLGESRHGGGRAQHHEGGGPSASVVDGRDRERRPVSFAGPPEMRPKPPAIGCAAPSSPKSWRPPASMEPIGSTTRHIGADGANQLGRKGLVASPRSAPPESSGSAPAPFLDVHRHQVSSSMEGETRMLVGNETSGTRKAMSRHPHGHAKPLRRAPAVGVGGGADESRRRSTGCRRSGRSRARRCEARPN